MQLSVNLSNVIFLNVITQSVYLLSLILSGVARYIVILLNVGPLLVATAEVQNARYIQFIVITPTPPLKKPTLITLGLFFIWLRKF